VGLVKPIDRYGTEELLTLIGSNWDVLDALLGTHSDKIGDSYVTPEMFGAKGDNVANDTEAIMKAISTGKAVHFEGKTYRIVVPSSNTYFALEANGLCPKFQGVKGKTVLRLDLDSSVDESSNSKSGILVAWNTEIKGIQFDGGYDPSKSKSNLSSVVTVGANSRVRGCGFKNARGSNVGVTGSNVKIHHSDFDTFGDHAVYIHQEYANTRISKIKVYDNEMTEDNTYQNGVQGGQIRGVIKIRDNVEDVDVYNNRITGDQCVLVSCKAISANGIASKIDIYNNKLYTSYSGVHLDTDLTTDNGFRITKDDVSIYGNDIFASVSAGVVGVALEYSAGTIKDNEIVSLIADNTNSGVSDFGTGDTGKSIVTGNKFRKVRLGVYRIGSGSIVEGNQFHDITSTGGCGVYSQYADRILNNQFFSCVEGLRIVGVRATKKSVYDNNSFYDCVKGILQKTGSSGYSLTNSKFHDCTTASLELESATAFRAEKNFNNVVYSGVALPEAVSSSSVVHSSFDYMVRTTLPGAIPEFHKKSVLVLGNGAVDDKLYTCIQVTGTNTFAWKQVSLV